MLTWPFVHRHLSQSMLLLLIASWWLSWLWNDTLFSYSICGSFQTVIMVWATLNNLNRDICIQADRTGRSTSVKRRFLMLFEKLQDYLTTISALIIQPSQIWSEVSCPGSSTCCWLKHSASYRRHGEDTQISLKYLCSSDETPPHQDSGEHFPICLKVKRHTILIILLSATALEISAD